MTASLILFRVLNRVRLPIVIVAVLVLVACLTSLPRTTWEGEEVRFVDALRTWDPLELQPEPPGYPLYVGVGRLVNFFVHDPFSALVSLSVMASVAGAVITALAAGAILGSAWAGAAAALVLYLSPAMLVFGPLPNPESVALACLALAFFALVRERPLLFGIAAAAIVGAQPETFPAALVLLIGGCVMLRPWLPAISAFAVSLVVFFVPLVEGVGVGRVAEYAAANFQSLQIASRASGLNTTDSLLRFVAHPWGGKFLAFPLLLAGVAGFAVLIRRKGLAAVLALFAAAHLAFCVAYADRGDGVQPAIPAMIAVAVFVAGVLTRWPALAFTAALLYGSASYAYVAPILSERRSGPSPAAAATMYARTALPRNAILLYDGSMEAYARHSGLLSASLVAADPLAAPLEVPLFLLADGGSQRKGSTAFAWPDSDAYGKVTTERCRVVSVSPFRAKERYRAVSGVYGFQRTAGQEWRWLAPTAVLEVIPQSDEIAIGLALPADAPIAENVVTITAGTATRTVTIHRGEQVAAVLPLEAPRLELRSARTFTPPDGRQLAVQLRGLQQRP